MGQKGTINPYRAWQSGKKMFTNSISDTGIGNKNTINLNLSNNKSISLE